MLHPLRSSFVYRVFCMFTRSVWSSILRSMPLIPLVFLLHRRCCSQYRATCIFVFSILYTNLYDVHVHRCGPTRGRFIWFVDRSERSSCISNVWYMCINHIVIESKHMVLRFIISYVHWNFVTVHFLTVRFVSWYVGRHSLSFNLSITKRCALCCLYR